MAVYLSKEEEGKARIKLFESTEVLEERAIFLSPTYRCVRHSEEAYY